MRFIIMLASLLLAAVQAQAMALPATDSVTGGNETTTVGVQRFQSVWTATPDTKRICTRSGSE